MSLLSTQSALARPSMVVSRQMTDLERQALGIGELSLLIDPREVAPEYSRLTLRDRIGARPIQFNGGALGAINGNTALDLDGSSGLTGVVNYTVAPSYFFACVVEITSIADTNAFLSSVSTSGNRLFAGLVTSGGGTTAAFRLDHGVDAGTFVQAPAVSGKHLYWGGYDAASGLMQIGIDAVSPAAQATVAVQHKGAASHNIYGGATTWALSGKAGQMGIADRGLLGDENYSAREIILAMVAEYGGVALGI